MPLTLSGEGTLTGTPARISQEVFTTPAAYTGYAWNDVTGFVASITPTDLSSKVLVTVTLSASGRYDSDAYARLMRDGSVLAAAVSPAAGSRPSASFGLPREPGSGSGTVTTTQFTFLDTPGSITPVEYGIQVYGFCAVNRTNSDSDDIYHARAISMFTLMEVAT